MFAQWIHPHRHLQLAPRLFPSLEARRPSLLVLQLIGQPVEALVEAVPAGGTGGLDVPVAVT